MGIKSAVTCEIGLNSKNTPKYLLKSFGDSEMMSQIEFEAEVYGFAELLRIMLKNKLIRIAKGLLKDQGAYLI